MLRRDSGDVALSDPLVSPQTSDAYEQPLSYGLGQRHFFVCVAALGLVVDYALRVAMSVAAEKPANDSSGAQKNERETMFTELHWSNMQQGLVLGSFYIGYTLSQVPGGILASQYGAVRAFGVGIFLASLFSFLTPFAASNIWVLCTCRVFTGLSEGVVYPAAAQLLKVWVPPQGRNCIVAVFYPFTASVCTLERALLSTVIFSGAYAGTVIALPISAQLLERFGWPFIFYFWATSGVAWTVIWCFFVHETPATHPRITNEEKQVSCNTATAKFAV
jgi:MFS family permease